MVSWEVKKHGFLGSKKVWISWGGEVIGVSCRGRKNKKKGRSVPQKKRLYSHAILHWRGKQLKKRSNKS